MSAIAGAVFTDGRDMADRQLAAMAAAAVPRGFDGISRWHDGPAGLIRFHHATTPEDVGEVQPLAGPSGVVIAFDGRLDNRSALLRLLGERQQELVGAPDAAIVLALFETRGEKLLNDLVGDWAFAIWQPGPRRLFCGRSQGGWRPFLWTYDGKTFGFATEPRTLVVGLGLERRLNEGAVGEMISARFVTDTDTFWAGIQRLAQGSALVLEKGQVRTWHWHHGPFEDFTARSEADHVDRFRELLDQALIASMRSNTDVTGHLSGGLDSSTVIARLTELYRAGKVDRQVGAVSSRFPGEAQDETRWSKAVEEHLGITARVTARDPYSLDEARAWTAASYQLPLRPNLFDAVTPGIRIQRAAGERVLLTGEGGDDWLQGNFGHFPDMLLRGDLFGLLREAWTQFPDEPRYVALRRTGFLASAPIFSRAYREKFIRPHLVFTPPIPDHIRAEWAARIGLLDRWRSTVMPVDPPRFAQKQRYGVFIQARRHVNHDPVMAYAEANGIEIRNPLQDQRLTHFLIGVAGRMLRRDGQKKYLLREAMRGTLPKSVRTRQDKAIFITGLIDAIAERFRECPPQQMLPVKLGWVDGDKLEAMFAPAKHWRESGSREKLVRAPLGPLWFIVAMDMWLQHAFGV